MTAPKKNREGALISRILIAVPRRWPEARVWRRNVMASIPLTAVHNALDLIRAGNVAGAIEAITHARLLKSGMRGEPDIDGFIPVAGLGVRLGVEVKASAGDRQRDEQRICEAVYRRGGCIYVIARDEEQAIADIEAEIKRLEAEHA